MKTENDVKLMTVGELLDALKSYKKKYLEYDFFIWCEELDDEHLGVYGMDLDEDGDLRMLVDWTEFGGVGFITIEEVMEDLKELDRNTRIYLDWFGYYLALERDSFYEPDDDYKTISCDSFIIGEYDIPEPYVPTEKELRQAARREIWEDRKSSWKGYLEVATYVLTIPLVIWGLYHNIAAWAQHTKPVWEVICWLVILLLVGYVCIQQLFFPERE